MSPSNPFTATFVAYDDLGSHGFVTLADAEEHPLDYIVIQWVHEYSTQDTKTVFVDRNGQVWSGYGELKSVTLTRYRLIIERHDREPSPLTARP